jgi:opacity protein-like surface antigen
VNLGYRFGQNETGAFRVEAQGGYHAADGEAGFSDTQYFTYMGNLYYDFNTIFPQPSSGLHIAPYVGGGLGGVAVHLGDDSFSDAFDDTDSEFGYQLMAGVNLVAASMPNTDWVLGYRYLSADDNDFRAHNVELGLRFHF